MAWIDDSHLPAGHGGIEVIRPVGRRRISHVFHDVDGTHSLIRDWPPVMSATIAYAMTCGLPDDFDSPENLLRLAERMDQLRTDETDRFCVESAGLSALTQMEFGLRRAIELGNVPASAGLNLTAAQQQTNGEICRRIWAGQERFGDLPEPAEVGAFLNERTGQLFRFYETLLYRSGRDRNVAAARINPAAWRVPGSPEFVEYLHRIGCVNYFVTGAVLYEGGGMLEEVAVLGYQVGPGLMVEKMVGSTWDRKVPKDELFKQLFASCGVPAAQVLVIGDGRTEVKAGIDAGCVTISRLPPQARRQRELHTQLRTNYILADYTDPALTRLITPE